MPHGITHSHTDGDPSATWMWGLRHTHPAAAYHPKSYTAAHGDPIASRTTLAPYVDARTAEAEQAIALRPA